MKDKNKRKKKIKWFVLSICFVVLISGVITGLQLTGKINLFDLSSNILSINSMNDISSEVSGDLSTDSSDIQKIEDDYVDFIIPKVATHYWQPDGSDALDKYEVIVHNFTIKNDSNHILRFTWYGDRYLSDRVDIHYLFENGTLPEENIKPYSLAKYDEECLTDLKEEVALSVSEISIDDSKCIIKDYSEQVVFNNLTIETGTITGYKVKQEINDTCIPDDKINGVNCLYNVSTPIYSWEDYIPITIENEEVEKTFLAIDDIEVSACGTLSSDGKYTLISTPTPTTTNCFTISANNVEFNGNGKLITGDGGWGDAGFISNGYNNITIRNTKITNFYAGVNLISSYGSTLINNTITQMQGNGFGLRVYNSHDNVVTANKISNNPSAYGIALDYYGQYNTIANNTINESKAGFYFGWRGQMNNITNNSVSSCSDANIYLQHLRAEYNLFYNNKFNSTVYILNPSNAVDYWNVSMPFTYGSNVRGNGLIAGNYWGGGISSGYSDSCVDVDLNGICDLEYELDSYNKDSYPLSSKPYWVPEVEFVNPTLANNSIINKDNYEWNVTIDTPRINTIIVNSNETISYPLVTLFSGSLYNFDNRSALKENSSFVADVGLYNQNSSLKKGVIGAEWNETGKYGGSYEFKKVGDVINIPNENNLLNGYWADNTGFTISSWVRYRGISSGFLGWGNIVDNTNTSSGYRLYHVFGSMVFEVVQKNTTINSINFPVAGNLDDGEWHHITGVYNTTALLLYLDGIEQSKLNVNRTGEYFYPNKNKNISIGNDNENTDRHWNGSIDNLMYVNYFLSPNQIKSLYESSLTKINNTRYIYYMNVSDMSEGEYNYSLTAYDYNVLGGSSGASNTTGTYKIIYEAIAGGDVTFSNRMQTPSSPTMYDVGKKYEFNITAVDNTGNLIFSFNGVNYTTTHDGSDMYNSTLINLNNATYEYYFIGERADTTWQEDTHYTYVVQPNDAVCNVLFNTTSPKTYPYLFTVYSDCTTDFQLYYEHPSLGNLPIANNTEMNVGAGESFFHVYRNNRNFSNFYDRDSFYINPAVTTCSMVANEGMGWLVEYTYPTPVQVNGTCSNNAEWKMWRTNNGTYKDITSENATWVVLGYADGLGYWDYKINTTTSENYSYIQAFSLIHIVKNDSAFDILFNATSPLTYGDKFKVYSNSITDFNITRNGVLVGNNSEQSLSIGVYNFIGNIYDRQNYTYITDSELFEIVGDTTPPYFIEIPTNQTIPYGTELNYNINATDETAFDSFVVNDTVHFSINSTGSLKNVTLLLPAVYMVNITINDTTNNLNSTIINITINSPVDTTPPYFNEIPTNQTYIFDEGIYVKFNATDDIGISNFYSNDTRFEVLSTGWFYNSTTVGVGTYMINLSIKDTSSNWNWTVFNVTITQATSEIELRLNGTRNNKNFYINSTIPINATLLTGDMSSTINLYNGTTLLTSGISPIGIFQTFNETGTYNMTGIYPETQNYTRDSETWFVTILDYPLPPSNATGYNLCRYKSFGYYNTKLPFMKESGCI